MAKYLRVGDLIKVMSVESAADEHYKNKIGSVLAVREKYPSQDKIYLQATVEFIAGTSKDFYAVDLDRIFCPDCLRYKKGKFSVECDTCQFNLFKFSDNRKSKYVRKINTTKE